MKRVFSLILTIFMILAIVPFPALATNLKGNEGVHLSETHLRTIHSNTPVYKFPNDNPIIHGSKVITQISAGHYLQSSMHLDGYPYTWYYIDLYDGFISSEDVEAHSPDFRGNSIDVCQKCPYERLHETKSLS